MNYYDKDGTIISTEVWAAKFEDFPYRRVAETTLSDGTWVSTVWLGVDHQFGEGPPLIFETMVFQSRETTQSLDMVRYCTLDEAEGGHLKMVVRWQEIRDEGVAKLERLMGEHLSTMEVCNTGTLNKSHARRHDGNRTLCGQDVVVPNAGDEQLPLSKVECARCRIILNNPPRRRRRGQMY